jgi:parallel beta-helix repeat protein
MNIKDFSLGVWVESGQNLTISGSKITKIENGIYLTGSNNTLSTNTIIRYSGTGININGNLNYVFGNNVTEDRDMGTPTGINVAGDENTLSSNILINNYAGIQIWGKNEVLTGNAISSNLPINVHGICLPGPSTTYSDISYYS